MTTHLVNGRDYVEVDRNADIGDYVLITRYDTMSVRTVGRVKEFNEAEEHAFYADYISGSEVTEYSRGLYVLPNTNDIYKTLEPKEETDNGNITVTLEMDDEVLDLLANISNRLTKVERSMGELDQKIEVNADNIVTWAQETEQLKEEVDEAVGIIVGDIALLDERTRAKRMKGISL